MKKDSAQRGFGAVFILLPVFLLLLVGVGVVYFRYYAVAPSGVAVLPTGLPVSSAIAEPSPASSPSSSLKPSPTPAQRPIWGQSELVPGWRAFADKTLGFAVQFPPEMEVGSMTATVAGILRTQISIASAQSGQALVVAVWDNPERLTAAQWLDRNFENLYRDALTSGKQIKYSDMKVVKQLTVAGQLATQIQVADLEPYIVFTSYDKRRLYQINASVLTTKPYDVVLDSFRLI
jgi:hypothetical protein